MHTIEVLEKEKCVRVEFSDAMTKEEHEAGRAAAVQVLEKHGLNRILVDARKIDSKMGLFDDLEFTEDHQATPVGSARVAIVHREDESERFRFIENVSVNRGGNMKVFTDPDAALEWLTEA